MLFPVICVVLIQRDVKVELAWSQKDALPGTAANGTRGLGRRTLNISDL